MPDTDAMFDDPASIEDLVRAAGELPRLSPRFRKRVLAAAAAGRHRRDGLRRGTAAGAALLLAAALFAWPRPSAPVPEASPIAMIQNSEAAARGVTPRRVLSSLEGPPILIAGAEIGQWDHVEAFLLFREIQLHALRGTL